MFHSKVVEKINSNTWHCAREGDPPWMFQSLGELDHYVAPQLDCWEFSEFYDEAVKIHVPNFQSLEEIFKDFVKGHLCFIGIGGSGKTTLLNFISQKVLQENFLPEIKIVHYIQCNNLVHYQTTTAADLLFNNGLLQLDADEIKTAIRIAERHPEAVLFVIDSLVSLQYKFKTNFKKIMIDERSNPEEIFWNLISGNLFRGCRVITSSEESLIKNCHNSFRPDRIVYLENLTMESIEEVIIGYEGKKTGKETFEYLKTRAPQHLDLCKMPVMLKFTLLSLRSTSALRPSTSTEFMISVLQNILRSPYIREANINDILNKLKKLSHRGIKKNKDTITNDDLLSVNLEVDDLSSISFFRPVIKHQDVARYGMKSSEVMQFQNKAFKQFLSALYILEMDFKSFEGFVKKSIHTSEYFFVRRFVCGLLLNAENHETAEELLWGVENVKEKQHILKESFECQFGILDTEILHSLNEAKDGMIEIVRRYIHSISMRNTKLSVSDIYSIASVISRCERLFEIDLSYYRSAEKSEELHSSQIVHILSQAILKSSLKLHFLRLNGFKITDNDTISGIGRISSHCEVSGLHLSWSDVRSKHLQVLTSAMGNHKFLELQLYGNLSMGSDGMKAIGEICAKDCKLDLYACGLSANQLNALKSSLGKKKLRALHLDESRIRIPRSEDVVSVANLIPNVSEQIWLYYWRIKYQQWEDLQHELCVVHEVKNLKIQWWHSTDQEHFNTTYLITLVKPLSSATGASRSHAATRVKDIAIDDEIEQLDELVSKKYSKPSHIAKNITTEGGSIELLDCSLKIGKGATSKVQKFELEVISNPGRFPESMIPIAPVLHCRPSMTFERPVTITMRTWLRPTEDNELKEIFILSKKKEIGVWGPIDTVSIRKGNEIKFQVSHFCEFAAVIKPEYLCNLGYNFLSRVYVKKDTGRVACIFYKDKKALEDTEEFLHDQNYANALDIPVQIFLKPNTSVRAELKIDEPPTINASPFIPPFLLVNNEFIERGWNPIYSRINPGEYEGWIIGQCEIKRGEVVDPPHPIEVKWPIQLCENSNMKLKKVEARQFVAHQVINSFFGGAGPSTSAPTPPPPALEEEEQQEQATRRPERQEMCTSQ